MKNPDSPVTTSPKNLRWFVKPIDLDDAISTLFIFPHAGSGTVYYRKLAQELSKQKIEVILILYPGRENRYSEDSYEKIEPLIDDLGAAFAEFVSCEKPFSFLGHSMGSIIAFELIRSLEKRKLTLPNIFFCSGRKGPQLNEQTIAPDQLSDEVFIQQVSAKYKAIPDQLLNNPEIIEIILPALKADFNLLYHYHFVPSELLDVSFCAMGGREDEFISEESLASWKQLSCKPFEMKWFNDGHFYIGTQLIAVSDYIVKSISCR